MSQPEVFVPDLDLEVGLAGLDESPRGLSFALSLPLCLAGLTLLLFARIGAARTEEPRRLTLALTATVLEPLPATGAPEPHPGGPRATGTVDPSLRRFADLHPERPQAPRPEPDLDAPLPGLPTEPAGLPLLPQGLPLAPGGNGLGSGTLGGPPRPAPLLPQPVPAPPPDADTFRILKQPMVTIRNARTGLSGWVRVRMTLDAEGVPLTATPLDGPPETWPQIVETVLQWRFHVPDREKAHAPIRLEVRFKLVYK